MDRQFADVVTVAETIEYLHKVAARRSESSHA
jgi:hypothetical protein